MNRLPRAWVVGIHLMVLCTACAACSPEPPELTPSPLPSATQDVLPSSTPTPAATIPPTATRQPKPTATPLARIESDPSGIIHYTDHLYGFKMAFPDGWLLINLTNDSLKQAFDESGIEDPDEMNMIADTLAQFPQGARLIGFLQADILDPNSTGTTAVLQPIKQSTASPQAFATFLEGVAETLRTEMTGVRLLDSRLLDPIHGHAIGRVDLLQEIVLSETDSVVGRYVYFYIQTSGNILMLMIGSQEDAFPLIKTDILEVLGSMEFTAPWP